METLLFEDKFSYEKDGGVIVTHTTTKEIPQWIFDVIDTGLWLFKTEEKFMKWYLQNKYYTWKEIGNALEDLRKQKLDKMLEKMGLKSRYTKRQY